MNEIVEAHIINGEITIQGIYVIRFKKDAFHEFKNSNLSTVTSFYPLTFIHSNQTV